MDSSAAGTFAGGGSVQVPSERRGSASVAASGHQLRRDAVRLRDLGVARRDVSGHRPDTCADMAVSREI
jgi:hypothetical protein